MQNQKVTIRDLVPPTGIVPSYLTAVSRLCDAPMLYHLGALLSVLAASAAPNCVGVQTSAGRKKSEPLFLWMMLMGESGSRKTQALIKVKDLALKVAGKASNRSLLGARARSALGSRAGLIEMLRVEPSPWVLIEEAAVWFRANRAAYMHDGAATWCEIFDGQILTSNLVDNAKRNATKPEDPEIRVSLLATGATPAVMRATRPEDWTSGLLARVMILATDPPQDRPGPYDWSEPVVERLREQIRKMSENAKRSGVVRLDDDARRLWDSWLLDLARRMRGIYETPAILLRRLPAFALRIAYLYALSRGSFRASIDDMNRALRLCDLSYLCVLSLDLR
ncbi:MAG: DUF3987 domain-containing protein [Candidatus Bipolaricaulis sp.]|nr:DUF3987 domain-containing protein [Candidatus Bipolaricaulis sp.]